MNWLAELDKNFIWIFILLLSCDLYWGTNHWYKSEIIHLIKREIYGELPDNSNLLGRETNLQIKQGKTQCSGHLQREEEVNASPIFFWTLLILFE